MATGFQLNSAWGFQQRLIKPFNNMSSSVVLRQEIDQPWIRPWIWDNFYFDTDYSGSTYTVTKGETLSAGGAGSGLAAGSILIEPRTKEKFVYLVNPVIIKVR